MHGLSDSVVRALPAGPRTDALHGVPFGQPAHPALVRLPLGCWTSAVLLDLFRGTERATAVLIAAGVAGTVPAAATGLADWSALHEDQQRVGLVHAICQAGAATLFLGSLAARAGGRPGYGRVLSVSGLFMGTIGAYLGGRLAQVGVAVRMLARGAHLAALQTQGLAVQSVDGDFTVPPSESLSPNGTARLSIKSGSGLRSGTWIVGSGSRIRQP